MTPRFGQIHAGPRAYRIISQQKDFETHPMFDFIQTFKGKDIVEDLTLKPMQIQVHKPDGRTINHILTIESEDSDE